LGIDKEYPIAISAATNVTLKIIILCLARTISRSRRLISFSGCWGNTTDSRFISTGTRGKVKGISWVKKCWSQGLQLSIGTPGGYWSSMKKRCGELEINRLNSVVAG